MSNEPIDPITAAEYRIAAKVADAEGDTYLADLLKERAANATAIAEPVNFAEIIATAIRDHQPTTGMRVASGETCRCGYWNGNERAGKDRPVGCGGLTWHQAREAEARIVAALKGRDS